jgi:hypothetical protein
MVQIPYVFSHNPREAVTGTEIADYLQKCANDYSAMGWEFYRIDTMSFFTHPGCLGALFGSGGQQTQYSVITFRRMVSW